MLMTKDKFQDLLKLMCLLLKWKPSSAEKVAR